MLCSLSIFSLTWQFAIQSSGPICFAINRCPSSIMIDAAALNRFSWLHWCKCWPTQLRSGAFYVHATGTSMVNVSKTISLTHVLSWRPCRTICSRTYFEVNCFLETNISETVVCGFAKEEVDLCRTIMVWMNMFDKIVEVEWCDHAIFSTISATHLIGQWNLLMPIFK